MADGPKSKGRQASPEDRLHPSQCAVNGASQGTSQEVPCLGFSWDLVTQEPLPSTGYIASTQKERRCST